MEKIFYKIKEVAEMLKISAPTIRYWEKEIPQLSPRTNENGTRFYTEGDIQIIKQIIYLTDVQQLRLEGVKRKLAENKDEVQKKQEVVERLGQLRGKLKAIITRINTSK